MTMRFAIVSTGCSDVNRDVFRWYPVSLRWEVVVVKGLSGSHESGPHSSQDGGCSQAIT